VLLLLTEQQGLPRDDAYSLMSVAADFSMTPVVDGRQGIHCKIARSIFLRRKSCARELCRGATTVRLRTVVAQRGSPDGVVTDGTEIAFESLN